MQFSGLCTVTARSWGRGWHNRGLAGVITHNHHLRRSPFANGGSSVLSPCLATIRTAYTARERPELGIARLTLGVLAGRFNGGWTWRHPYLACAHGAVNMAGKYVFARNCPAGSQNVGLYGIIMLKHHYRSNPFHK